ncbi:MAG: hypothetical protein OHK0019_08600 [Saprospiraceae bacterium]
MVNTIKGLIGEGQTQEAISQMAKFATGQSDIHNAVIQISGQYSQANFSFAMNLTDAAANQAAISKINFALLNLLDQMQLQGLFSGDKPSLEEEEGPRSKLLFLASNPVDMAMLQLEKEYLEIRKIFKNHRKKFIITEEFDASLDTFFEALDREKPQIIHLSGFSDEGGVFLSNKIDRTSYLVPFEFLAPAFKMLRSSAECVFFNTGSSNLFAKVVSRSIPYAVGIKGMVHDHEAITFSSGFYAALALEKNYEKAFKMGRDLLANLPPMSSGKADKNAKDEKQAQKFFLYQNGLCDEDTDTPDDFYVPQEATSKEKK